jgi:hypothetical protein
MHSTIMVHGKLCTSLSRWLALGACHGHQTTTFHLEDKNYWRNLEVEVSLIMPVVYEYDG